MTDTYRFEDIEEVSLNNRIGNLVDIYKFCSDNDAYFFSGRIFVQGNFSEKRAIEKFEQLTEG